MRTINFFLTILLGIMSHVSLGQYQFPNDAVTKIKGFTQKYVNQVKDERYVHLQMQISKNQKGQKFDVRNTDFFKVDSLVIIETNGVRYFIDNQMMVMVNDEDEKLYIKEFEAEDRTTLNLFEGLDQSIDSILSYTSTITYTEKSEEQIKFQIQIAPENYYVFDNLMKQDVYYSVDNVLPDSVVKTFYDAQLFKETTSYNLVSLQKPKQYPFQRSLSYFFDENQKIKVRYQNYSIMTL